MKKILLFISSLLLTVSVSASSLPTEIKIDEVKIEVSDKVSYKEEVKLTYSINPIDADNLNLVWSIVSGDDLEVTIDKNKTNDNKGELLLNVNNTSSDNVSFTIIAKQNKKVLVSKEIIVESKNETTDRINDEVSKLIDSFDSDITAENYEDNKEIIENINEILDNNEITLDDEVSTKYDEINKEFNEYQPTSNLLITIITIILIAVFTGLLFWIFNKED